MSTSTTGSSFSDWLGSFTLSSSESSTSDTKSKKKSHSAPSQQDLQDLNTLARMRCWKAIEECAAEVESIHHTTPSKAGNPPLHTAISNGAPLSTVQASVIANPPSVALQNNFGNTPLHFAAWKNKYTDSFAIVQFLLDYHPQSAKIANKHGNLPLHHATNYKAGADIVQILYRAYPKAITVENDKGKTPLDFAIHRLGSDQHPIVALLKGESARNFVYQQFAKPGPVLERSPAFVAGDRAAKEETTKITADVWDEIDLTK